jgi:dissimilatory sulfite reductase (desulfoviridin) alpha/beta subunit
VYLGGCGGKTPRIGFKLERIFNQKEALSVIAKVVKFYKEHAQTRQRLALLIEEFGREKFITSLDIG